jgi:hypothetical protein
MPSLAKLIYRLIWKKNICDVFSDKIDKYEMLSPYNYALNNPIENIDPDGKDARVGINDSSHTITLSSTIFVIGYNAKDQADKYNQFTKDNSNLLSGSYTDENGVKWTINLDLTYKEGTDDDVQCIKDHPNGDNVIEVGKDGGFAHADEFQVNPEHLTYEREDPNDPSSKIVGRYDPSGRKTSMGIGNGKSPGVIRSALH